jgi:hypothetical protein
MDKKVPIYLEKVYDYKLKNHKILIPKIKRNYFHILCYILFIGVTVLYALDLFVYNWGYINFFIYYLSFFFLVAIPKSQNKQYRKEILIITPTELIQRVSKKEFVFLTFDDITYFNHFDNKIVLRQNKFEIKFDVNKYISHLAILIDILEAKGKTFDKQREYMIRNIKIVVEDDTVKIEDCVEEVSYIEELAMKVAKNYPNVTPGYINEIVFEDTSIFKAYYRGKDLYLECNGFEVQYDHPENTGFDKITAHNAIVVFVDFHPIDMRIKAKKELEDKYEEIRPFKKTVIEKFNKGVILNFKKEENEIDITLHSGVDSVKVLFSYDDVLIGWNEEK